MLTLYDLCDVTRSDSVLLVAHDNMRTQTLPPSVPEKRRRSMKHKELQEAEAIWVKVSLRVLC